MSAAPVATSPRVATTSPRVAATSGVVETTLVAAVVAPSPPLLAPTGSLTWSEMVAEG